jgi:hypothetical protein
VINPIRIRSPYAEGSCDVDYEQPHRAAKFQEEHAQECPSYGVTTSRFSVHLMVLVLLVPSIPALSPQPSALSLLAALSETRNEKSAESREQRR